MDDGDLKSYLLLEKVEGFKPYTGGEELRRAIAALAGPTIAQEQEVRPLYLVNEQSSCWAVNQ